MEAQPRIIIDSLGLSATFAAAGWCLEDVASVDSNAAEPVLAVG